MEYWSIGVLEWWSFGVLEYWSIGVVEFWSDFCERGERSEVSDWRERNEGVPENFGMEWGYSSGASKTRKTLSILRTSSVVGMEHNSPFTVFSTFFSSTRISEITAS